MPECGIEGWAKVLGIGKCPQISPRPGPEFQLVTATFKHHANQILDVYIADETDPIGTTPNHPFWSQDKQKFIRADELTAGERLRKANGTLTTVTHITPRAGTNTVYNLEIQLNHTYHIDKTGVLVHNGNTCAVRFDSNVNRYRDVNGRFASGPRGAVIGKVKDLNILRPGEWTLLKHLPDQGSPRLNWRQNSRVLRREIRKRKPIRDASLRPDGGLRVDRPSSFLEAERNLLRSQGWSFDSSTGLWSPP